MGPYDGLPVRRILAWDVFTGFNEVAGWRHVSRMAQAAGMDSTQPQPLSLIDRNQSSNTNTLSILR
jgi:hypothetical protein